jgi:hypothetical protein
MVGWVYMTNTEEYLTYLGKPLKDYRCPKCDSIELRGIKGGDYFTCMNCGKIPIEELKSQWGKL